MKRFMAMILGLLFLSGGALIAAEEEPEKEETPHEAVKRIIALYKARDFETLIRERYTEIHKADNEEKVEKLIDVFRKRFSDDVNNKLAVEAYEKALGLEPEIKDSDIRQKGENGKMAVFSPGGFDRGTMRLYQMENGKWGFHL